MADDGLLLNFAAVDSIAAIKPTRAKYTGGSWRERSRLTKNAKRDRDGLQKEERVPKGADAAYVRATRGGKVTQDGDFPETQPTKRRKANDSTAVTTSTSSGQSANGAVKKRPLNREVVSSLFTYNPTPQQPVEEIKEEDLQPVAPSNAPLPDGIDTFTSLGLSSTLAAHLLTKMDLKTPTAIQKATITHLSKDDSDTFIQSETGSGKTLAYLLPVVQRIMSLTTTAKTEAASSDATSLSRHSGLFAIILAPTRELCKQILIVLERVLGCAHYIVAGTVIGGEKKKSEKARLRKGLNILVATPGRLVDHLENTKTLDVSLVRYFVLDEGDRLMDLGFEEDITKIVGMLDSKKRKGTLPGLPERRINMLCSATLKMNVQKLGDISLKDATLIKSENDTDHNSKSGGADSGFLAPAQLKQSFIVAAAKLRLVALTALLRRTFARKGSVMKAIVFVSCADSVEFHFKTLTRQPKEESAEPVADTKEENSEAAVTAPKPIPEVLVDAVSSAPLLSSSDNPLTIFKLHGSLPQVTRSAIVKTFAASDHASLLIATDVASRGLDLPNLDLVIEYDPAFSTDEHLHRIGRTARLGRDGRAIIFLLPGKEENYVEILKQSFKKDDVAASSSNVTSQTVDDVLRKGFTPSTGVISTSTKEWESKATDYQLDVERWVLSDPKIRESARKAYTSHIRAYATHVANERKYFDIKELHLGHLAKAFGLRDPPGKVNVQGLRGKDNNNNSSTASNSRIDKRHTRKSTNTNTMTESDPNTNTNTNTDGNTGISTNVNGTTPRKRERIEANPTEAKTQFKTALNAKADIDEIRDADDAAKKMRDMVRNRKKMMGAGADEFNIA